MGLLVDSGPGGELYRDHDPGGQKFCFILIWWGVVLELRKAPMPMVTVVAERDGAKSKVSY